MSAGRCDQKGCINPSSHRFTWPGWAETEVCERHALKARAAAKALDLPVYDLNARKVSRVKPRPSLSWVCLTPLRVDVPSVERERLVLVDGHQGKR
jgi:hypothetical protein